MFVDCLDTFNKSLQRGIERDIAGLWTLVKGLA
jgi:hypothetical protein